METRLKEARKAAGLNQRESAKELGVSLGTYRNWEQGRVVMNGEQLMSAATLFNTTVDFILMTDADTNEDTKAQRQKSELSSIYDSIDEDGRRALMTFARALADEYGD